MEKVIRWKITRIALACAAGLVLAAARSMSVGPGGWEFPDLFVALLLGGAVTFSWLRDPARSVSTMNVWVVLVLLSLLVTYQAFHGTSTDLQIAVAVSVAFLGILLAYRKVVTAAAQPIPAERVERGA